MAALTTNQVVKQFSDGASSRTVLYALRNVTAGDTADLAADFSVVKRAVVLGTTVNGALAASVATTIATMPAGLANDAAWLLAWGASA